MSAKKRGLGRGLNALLPERPQIPERSPRMTAETAETEEMTPETRTSSRNLSIEEIRSIREIPIDKIEVNPFQPRKVLDPEALEDLAKSIRAQGVLQPILVRPVGDRYQILVGERRWRASRMAELDMIPAVIHDVDDEKAHEWALIENLQREDLNPVEEARAYQTLMAEFGLNQEEVAQRVGKDRVSVANSVRLLNLPPEILEDISAGRLTAGHGRVLLGLESDPLRRKLRGMIIRKGMSVRMAEKWVRSQGSEKPRKEAGRSVLPPEMQDIQDYIEERLKTRVTLRPMSGSRGKIEILYSSMEDFERIGELLCGDTKWKR